MIRVAHAHATFYDDGAMRPSPAVLIEIDYASFSTVRLRVGPEAMMLLLEVAALAYVDDTGRLVADTNAGDLAQRLAAAEPGAPVHRGWSRKPVSEMLARLETAGFVIREQPTGFDGSRSTFSPTRIVLSPRLYLVDDRRTDAPSAPAGERSAAVVGTLQVAPDCAVPNSTNTTAAAPFRAGANQDSAIAALVGDFGIPPGQRAGAFSDSTKLDTAHHDDVDEKNHHHELTEQAIRALEQAGVQGDLEELVRTCGATNVLAWVDYASSNQRIGNPAAYIAAMVRRRQPPPTATSKQRPTRTATHEPVLPAVDTWRQVSQRDLDDILYSLPEHLANEVQTATRYRFGRPVRDASDAAELRSLLVAELASRDLLNRPAGATA